MADYVFIQNYSNRGKMAISTSSFEQIVSIVTNKVIGVSTTKKNNSPFRFHKPVHCSISNNKVIVNIQVIIKKGNNVDKICALIQDEVAEALTTMVEMVPFSIKIKVAGIE